MVVNGDDFIRRWLNNFEMHIDALACLAIILPGGGDAKRGARLHFSRFGALVGLRTLERHTYGLFEKDGFRRDNDHFNVSRCICEGDKNEDENCDD